MVKIDIDAAKLTTISNLYDALSAALQVPEWHGRSINAFVDSMIWHDNINGIKPPYLIRVCGRAVIPKLVWNEIEMLQQDLRLARLHYREMHGQDIEVELELAV